MLASGFVVNGFVQEFATLPVIWSLEVELIFYVLIAGLARAKKLHFLGIFLTSLACGLFACFGGVCLDNFVPHSVGVVIAQLRFDALQITYLFIGATLYQAATSRFDPRSIAYIVLALAMFYASHRGYVIVNATYPAGIDQTNGEWAFIIFLVAFWSGLRWRWLQPLQCIANISYSLYLIHIPMGCICIVWLAVHGFSILSTGIITGLAITLVAYLAHIFIEEPLRLYGAALSRRISPRPPRLTADSEPEIARR